MGYLRFAVAGLALGPAVGLILCASRPAMLRAASSNKPSCKKIHDAVWAGKTMEQITAEFDTDADTVMKCTQKKGKRKAKPKGKKQGGSKSKSSKADSSTSSSSTPKSTKPGPSKRKSSAPASGPRPAYLP